MRGDERTLFLVAFQELKNATDDSPSVLEGLWEGRPDLQELCDRLNGYRLSFDIAEERTSVAFTPHVPAAAVKARRDYEDRWQSVVAHIANREFMADLDEIFPNGLGDEEPDNDPLGSEIDGWQNVARRDARNIERAISYVVGLRSWDDDNDLEWVDEAEQSWDRLIEVVGLDLQGAFWRRNAIPHTLFPSHVSKRYGSEKSSIYRRLHDAARAFTFGAYLAALAMQRSVMEQLLKRHWNAERGDPANANFVDQSQSSRASRLRRLGNEALHREIDQLMDKKLERAVIKNFLLLRELIELTPENEK